MTSLPDNFLLFLGTAGARYSMIHQLRSTGGMWARIMGKNIVIDPGPGSLVRICEHRPLLDPTKIDAIIVTHRHIDHSTDLNVLVEAMTGGARTQKGTVILPQDGVLSAEPLLYSYLRRKVENLHIWAEGKTYSLGAGISLNGVRLLHHGVDCFGMTFTGNSFCPWGILSDTQYLPDQMDFFSECRMLIANITLRKRVGHIQHLSIDDITPLLKSLHPDLLLLSHLGISILKEGPEKLAGKTSTEKTLVVAARDKMIVNLDTLNIVCQDKTGSKELSGSITRFPSQ